MRVAFAEPGVGTGGLDAAIGHMRQGLCAAGVTVVKAALTHHEPVDVIHFHGLWQPWHSQLSKACRTANMPYVVSPHGMLEPWAWKHKWWKKKPYFYLRERQHLAMASCLLATSAMEKNNLAQFFPDHRIEVIPLGLTGEARPNYEAARASLGWSGRVILYLSRLHEKKGLHLLLEALAAVALPADTRLVIVGDGKAAYEKRVRDLARRLAEKLPRVDWVGPVWGEDRWRYFQGADLFCLPSHSENFGLAVLEALQVGTRVLVSENTPWKDFFQEDAPLQAGYVVRPTVTDVQLALEKFFSEPPADMAKRTVLADWAWSGFAWDKLIDRMITMYAGLIKT